ncbi:UDP-N-acetylmuramate dehydrogenase [Acinetobacter qingfengensis]|uniref:UDP-N-acetylenolpyruvoylglucosamine reductase n=1 Tax=Acinetobacter qingfengensis TaxID=1262585 RepID=A0A1E7RDS9_9GAMM|nr:UDP-N-acetylmuramate dehydrogenase [Acinetobacter qingfengensis]KAA8735328.1 UDP-N-acetylmuramate dehydrogenase [Acinetobacter qingfengensis]OEY97446.1 UDP-N-acetylenolpyruvoylglucosamine reductase [Acinetobacter qingfengensis]
MNVVQHQFDLTALNTLALYSQTSDYVRIDAIDQIEDVVQYAKQHQLNIFILSGGSNVLLPEKFQSLTVHMLNQGKEIVSEDDDFVVIKVQAGEIWHDFVCDCCAKGYHGLENLALIPGRVGAAPIQNIGAYGVEAGEFIEHIWAYDLQQQQHVNFTADQCQFAYRDSIFKQQAGRYLIYALSFRLRKQADLKLNYADVAKRVGDTPTAEKLLNTIVKIRSEKLPQPALYPNAGSFFKNPILSALEFTTFIQKHPNAPHYLQADGSVKVAAGWLIDQAGWKGKKLGQVGMFERQALVLVNYGQANLQDVQRTYQTIQTEIFQKFAIVLQPEPVQINRSGQIQPYVMI